MEPATHRRGTRTGRLYIICVDFSIFTIAFTFLSRTRSRVHALSQDVTRLSSATNKCIRSISSKSMCVIQLQGNPATCDLPQRVSSTRARASL